MKYEEFIKNKKTVFRSSGFDAVDINPMLFDFQRDIVKWACKKGRAALFEDCGLGKTPQQLEWARQVCNYTHGNVLILAPLAVSKQTKREGEKFGIPVNICRTQEDVIPGINITNYEMLQHFDASEFSGIVLDEAGIIKNQSGKIRNEIIDAFINTPYKLSCTATPAPNDYMELGNQCEFLGVLTRTEMLATFFVHDGGDTAKWRLKGHAEDKFWEWISSWAVVLSKPADLGYDDGGFELPPLTIHEIKVEVDPEKEEGQMSLFADIAQTMDERRKARRSSLDVRVEAACELVNTDDTGNQWLVWCDLNDESEQLAHGIIDSVEVKGANTDEHKENAMIDFALGKIHALVSKPKISGYGMNWQNCSNMIFVGLSDSYEMLYQAIRRCWRFGQDKPVDVYMVISEQEGAVKANIERKERDYQRMFSEMVKHTQDILREEVHGTYRHEIAYKAEKEMILPEWVVSEYEVH